MPMASAFFAIFSLSHHPPEVSRYRVAAEMPEWFVTSKAFHVESNSAA